MANTFLTPKLIAKQALLALNETTVMAQLVHRDYEPEFMNKIGQTVSVRKPAVFEADDFVQSEGIRIQDASEDFVDVTLQYFSDVSFAVTSKQMTLEIEDFDEQLLTPAMEALAQKIDRNILKFRDDITAEVGAVAENAAGEDYNYPGGHYPWSDSRVLIEAGAELDKLNIPMLDRRVVVGPTTKSRWIAEKAWRSADRRGSTEGLLEASFGGRTSGFDPYMTQNIGQPASSPVTGAPTTEVDVAFHKTAVALVTRQLVLPAGAKNAAIQNYKGFGLRVVWDYDINTKRDIISIDCLYGVKVLDPNRAILIKGADAA